MTREYQDLHLIAASLRVGYRGNKAGRQDGERAAKHLEQGDQGECQGPRGCSYCAAWGAHYCQ